MWGPRGLLTLMGFDLLAWSGGGVGGCAEGSSSSGRLGWGQGSLGAPRGQRGAGGGISGDWALLWADKSGGLGCCPGLRPQQGLREAAQGHMNCLLLQNSPSLFSSLLSLRAPPAPGGLGLWEPQALRGLSSAPQPCHWADCSLQRMTSAPGLQVSGKPGAALAQRRRFAQRRPVRV